MTLVRARAARAMVLACLGMALAGCQGTGIQAQKLAHHQAEVEKTGLTALSSERELKLVAAPPVNWVALPTRSNALYTHKQWRSPSKATGVGAVYIRMPLPFPVQTLAWLAKAEYTKRENGGRLIGEWKDAFGRHWFEAENDNYHVRGYAITNGLDAWIVYSGYRRTMAYVPSELALADRCLESILVQPAAAAATDLASIAD